MSNYNYERISQDFYINILKEINSLITNINSKKSNFKNQRLIENIYSKLLNLKNLINNNNNYKNKYFTEVDKYLKIIDNYVKNEECMKKCFKNVNQPPIHKPSNSKIKNNFSNISSKINSLIKDVDNYISIFKNKFNKNQQKLIEIVNSKLLELIELINYDNNNRNKYFNGINKYLKIIDNYLKNQECVNKCSLYGFKIITVPGDGTCGYHAVMKSMQIMKINIKDKINNLKLKIQTEGVILDGLFLREILAKYLDKFSNENIQVVDENTQVVDEILQYTDNLKNSYKDGKLLPLKDRINILKNQIIEKNTWMPGEVLLLISFVFQICIFILNRKDAGKNEKNNPIIIETWWTIAHNPNYIKNFNKKNNIFITYRAYNHYDSLEPPPNKIFKDEITLGEKGKPDFFINP